MPKLLTSLRFLIFINENLLTMNNASTKVGESVKKCNFVGLIFVVLLTLLLNGGMKGFIHVSGCVFNES